VGKKYFKVEFKAVHRGQNVGVFDALPKNSVAIAKVYHLTEDAPWSGANSRPRNNKKTFHIAGFVYVL
jgi:hypothetical protein